MLLLTVVYDSSKEYIIDEIRNVKQYFEVKKVIVGISESIIEDTHFIKIFCSDDSLSDNNMNLFNLYVSNILYKVVITEFCKKEINNFLTETYFFLRNDEIRIIKPKIEEALFSDSAISDPSVVYYINRKNEIIKKIIKCIEENREINVNGFITFRMKELRGGLERIIDKVVEEYMVEKEYNEFIKLLKYFVEVQDSKVEEVNIIIQNNGSYSMIDKEGNDLAENLIMELPDIKFDCKENQEDLIISTLITTAPKKVIIHCIENCKNKELIETIGEVFVNRVYFCDDCTICQQIKNGVKK